MCRCVASICNCAHVYIGLCLCMCLDTNMYLCMYSTCIYVVHRFVPVYVSRYKYVCIQHVYYVVHVVCVCVCVCVCV